MTRPASVERRKQVFTTFFVQPEKGFRLFLQQFNELGRRAAKLVRRPRNVRVSGEQNVHRFCQKIWKIIVIDIDPHSSTFAA